MTFDVLENLVYLFYDVADDEPALALQIAQTLLAHGHTKIVMPECTCETEAPPSDGVTL